MNQISDHKSMGPDRKETPQDKTTAVAKQIIADDQKRQLEQIAKLKAARIEKEEAEALLPVSRKRKLRKG